MDKNKEYKWDEDFVKAWIKAEQDNWELNKQQVAEEYKLKTQLPKFETKTDQGELGI